MQAAVFFCSSFRMGKWVLVCDQMGFIHKFYGQLCCVLINQALICACVLYMH